MSLHFGEHLMIDGYEGEESLLDNKGLVLSCLEELPSLLEMKPLSKPEIYRAEKNDFKDPGGWTGVVIIAESHISIHTFPKRGFVSIDVYTCKNGLNINLILEYFKIKFLLKDIESQLVKRGSRYPQNDIY